LLLEGNDIQELLARVRAEHGPAARIVSADRVRATGMAALFARERYELTIELAEGSATDTRGLPSSTTAALTQLTTTTTMTTTASAAGAATVPAGATSPADTLIAMVEARERELRPYLGPDESAAADSAMQAAQEVSAGAAAFAEVLTGYGVPAWKVPVVSTTAAPGHADPAAAGPKAVAPITAPVIVKSDVAEPVIAQPATPAQDFTTPDFTTPDFTTPDFTTPDFTTPAEAAAPLIPRYEPDRLPYYASLPTALTRLGMPIQLVNLISGFDSYREIVRVIKLLPEAPTATGAGEVLVIAGELRSALEVARTVAESLDLPATRVALAAASCKGTGIHPSRRMKGPEYSARRITRLRRKADLPIIVVVDVPADGSGTEWANSIIEHCDATAIWGVADATRKTADSARRLADIGRVDAIAACGCAETDDPATVLQLGIPVAMIDGRTATPTTWAELLCRRLEEVME
jgi:hypothetical protein